MAFDFGSFIGSNIGATIKEVAGIVRADPTVVAQNKADLDKLQAQITESMVAQVTAQIDVDKAEAANANMFVAGWRPFCGWVCGTGLGVQFLVNPLATWIAALLGHPIAFPGLDLGTLLTLLFGMLGLGGLRSYDKAQGAVGADKLQ